MTEYSRQAIRQSGYLRAGFADHYDAFRPSPPAVLLDALARYAGSAEPARVVDLGSGTGLSTRAWADRAGEVIGVEPNPEMRKVAERRTEQPNVRYVEAFASDTGLEAASADVVTCSQSFHWMERGPVLAEAARILREGGVFAAYDYDFPALIHPEVDAAFVAHLELRRRYRDAHKVEAGWTRTPKTGHLDAIRESGLFAYTRELVVHDELDAGAEEIVGFARSLGLVPELLALGVSEDDLGLTALDETVRRVIGDRRVPGSLGLPRPARRSLAADLGHRARRTDEAGVVDLVLQLLVLHGPADEARELLVARALAQRRLRGPTPGARRGRCGAGRPRSAGSGRSDEQNGSDTGFTNPTSPLPSAKRNRRAVEDAFAGISSSGQCSSISARISRAGEDVVAGPALLGVEGHELDEPDDVRLAAGELGERGHLLLGEAADRDAVDLDRPQLRDAPRPPRARRAPGRARRVA